MSENI